MNTKTKYLAAGLAAIMLIGMVGAVGTGVQEFRKQGKRGMFGGGHGMFGQGPGNHGRPQVDLESLGLPADATREQVREAMWAKKLADLGLTEESTLAEFHAANVARHDERQAEMLEKRTEMLAKLGLTEDALPEDVREAMKAYCEQNPDDCPAKGPRGMKGGRAKGGYRGSSPLTKE